MTYVSELRNLVGHRPLLLADSALSADPVGQPGAADQLLGGEKATRATRNFGAISQ